MEWKITLQSSLDIHSPSQHTHTYAYDIHTPHIHTKHTTYSHPYDMDSRATNDLNFIFSGQIQRITDQARRVTWVSTELLTWSPQCVCIGTVCSFSQGSLFCGLSPYHWINWRLAQPLLNWARWTSVSLLPLISHLRNQPSWRWW